MLIACLHIWAEPGRAAAPAGTRIVNQAAVTFLDASGLEGVSLTNEVSLTVQPVFASSLSNDQNRDTLAGTAVLFHHQLRNLGNTDDQYCLSLSAVSGAAFLDTVSLFLDTDHNGVVNSSDQLLIDSLSSNTEISIAAGQQSSLILQAASIQSADIGESVSIDLIAEAKRGTADCVAESVNDIGQNADLTDSTNRDRLTIVDHAVVTLEKASLYSNRDEPLDDVISYRLLLSNNGTSAATDLEVTDTLPEQLDFLTGSLAVAENVGGVTAAFTDDVLTATIPSLPAGETVTLTFRALVSSDETLDDLIVNSASVTGDFDSITGTEPPILSNETVDLRELEASVEITDTGLAASATLNDGGDDDGTLNDVQLVDQAPASGEILFKFLATNQGTGFDFLTPQVMSSDLPAGSVVRFLSAEGQVALTDQNGDGALDLGRVDPGGTREFVVALTLPSGETPTLPFEFPVTIASSVDASQTDTSTARIEQITSGQVDLANSSDANGLNDGGVVDADPASSITTRLNVRPGESATFALHLANEGQVAESFALFASGSADALTSLPDGMYVTFVTGDGQSITSTTIMAPNELFSYEAIVSISENAAAGESSVFFIAEGHRTGTRDAKQDAVVVDGLRQLTLSPESVDQINACGSAIHAHELRNPGGSTEQVTLSLNSNGRMTSELFVPTQVIADQPATFLRYGNLVAGDSIATLSSDTGAWQLVSLSDTANGLSIPLAPGDETRLQLNVFAPCRLQNGEQQRDEIVARSEDGQFDVSINDLTILATSQLRITKAGARDSGCDDTADGPFGQTGLTALPGECIIWKLSATNEGAALLCNVELTDGAPAFSTISTAPSISQEPAPGTGICTTEGETFRCSVGNSATNPLTLSTEPFCIDAGENAEVIFSVRIN